MQTSISLLLTHFLPISPLLSLAIHCFPFILSDTVRYRSLLFRPIPSETVRYRSLARSLVTSRSHVSYTRGHPHAFTRSPTLPAIPHHRATASGDGRPTHDRAWPIAVGFELKLDPSLGPTPSLTSHPLSIPPAVCRLFPRRGRSFGSQRQRQRLPQQQGSSRQHRRPWRLRQAEEHRWH